MSTATANRGSQTKHTTETTRPAHEIRLGRIKAAVWANETERGVRHNVTFQRIFVDNGGQWQTSSSFGRDDLPLLAKVADLAHTWIFENATESAGRDQGDQGGQF